MAFSEGGGWYRKKPRGLMGFNDPRSRSVYSPTPRTPFSSYEAAHSRSDMVVPRVSPTNKGFFGHMSPEELKDFQEVLKEMRTDIKPEFVGGGNYGRTQEYAHQPFLFDEATAAEYQRRKKFNPYV